MTACTHQGVNSLLPPSRAAVAQSPTHGSFRHYLNTSIC
ncbi:hypothetical protein LMG29542_08148 [Paraburkholderia humisilvae]|uniref:Uncharacterized protein n=1 Tax=Paraburkholderia humisilvae TaxID=627669 RepID=A0A6J5FBY0_9BURK|nr:hypothetical protein LMG29542_08148 [Paraburkholderia humisilvae]